jgi:hypothetical protein
MKHPQNSRDAASLAPPPQQQNPLEVRKVTSLHLRPIVPKKSVCLQKRSCREQPRLEFREWLAAPLSARL